MAEGIVFPDAETAIVDLLKGSVLLLGVQVGTRKPDTLPAEFLVVRRTGGPRETLVSERPQITVEAQALSEVRASQLLGYARAIIGAADGAVFGPAELSGPANLPDPETAEIGYVRYSMTFMVRQRGAGVAI